MSQRKAKSKSSTEFDSPWKDMIENYFESFMMFFFPAAYEIIDFSKGYEFLDKELQRVVYDSKFTDKLVKQTAGRRHRGG